MDSIKVRITRKAEDLSIALSSLDSVYKIEDLPALNDFSLNLNIWDVILYDSTRLNKLSLCDLKELLWFLERLERGYSLARLVVFDAIGYIDSYIVEKAFYNQLDKDIEVYQHFKCLLEK